MDLRLAHLEMVLKKDGIQSAAHYLNGRVPHRFTTIYRLDNEVFTEVEMVDKLGADTANMPKQTPYCESLCRFPVLHGTFTSSHTWVDPRLKGLQYPSAVGSYTGVTLPLSNGALYGTLCHYDFAPQSISHFEYQFLKLAAKLIARHMLENDEAMPMAGQWMATPSQERPDRASGS